MFITLVIAITMVINITWVMIFITWVILRSLKKIVPVYQSHVAVFQIIVLFLFLLELKETNCKYYLLELYVE